MTRLARELIARLEAEVSLVRLIEVNGIALTREGENWIGRCPFHEDTGLLLWVMPDTNRWQCRGDCQTGGSVIDWVMRWNGVSFRHAVEWLRNDPSLVAASSHPVKHSHVRRLPSPVSLDAEDQQLLNQVIDYYHATLKQSPEALAYLEKRGLKHSEMVERFKLGFANRTLGLRLPMKVTKAGGEIRGRLQKLGLLRASGHEHFTGALVVPVFDEQGNVTEVYGRKLRDDLKPGTAYHLYLPGPPRGVWNLEALQASKEIILCEALIDALSFWCAGYRHVTSSYGVEGFTADHLAAFRQYSTERVLIAYDRDDAGESAARRLVETLRREGIDCYRLHFPRGMDANEYALQAQPAEKSLGVVIRAALWWGQGQGQAGEEAAIIVAGAEAPITETALAASPVTLPTADIAADVRGEDVVIPLGDRRYRVRGLQKNLSLDQLKVNVLVSRGESFHVDTLELYAARSRAIFINQAAKELNLKEDAIKKDLGKVLLKLEELQEAHIRQTLAPAPQTVAISDAEKATALEWLRDPRLLDRLLADFTACGVVGEEVNKLVGYLAATSRKLDSPLAVMVQSSSAAGKSSLMEAVLAFMPEEDKVQYSAMTGQSLFYMDHGNLKHKILAIAEEQGAARAAYALKLLQSEGALAIASTGKDPETGKLVTHEYRVEGPVMIFSTTTAIDHDEELLNRCLTLGVDESREQTRAIHALQRDKRTLEGLIARRNRERIIQRQRNAQRLLRPLAVMNPYSHCLTFPDEATRTRRDHEKYLTLIDTIALLHQYQREVKAIPRDGATIEYVEVAREDIEVANRLAHEALGRSLDELAPQTRRLLGLIDEMVRQRCEALALDRADYRFSRRDVRRHSHWSDFQVKRHMHRLEELEYVLVHRGGRGQSFVYELLYDGQGQDGQPFLMGLIDSARLHADGPQTEPEKLNLERPGSPQGAGQECPGRGVKTPASALNQAASLTPSAASDQNAYAAEKQTARSYNRSDRRDVPPLVAVPENEEK